MRFVYVDEAGTSANEKVAVVAGIIIDPDSGELTELEQLLSEIKDRLVPPEYREGFVFHAAELFRTGNKDRFPGWDMGDRIAFALEVMSVPQRLGIPFSYGMVRQQDLRIEKKIDPVLLKHLMAFMLMVQAVNQHIELYGGDQEVAVLVCEQIKERHKAIRRVLSLTQEVPHELKSEHQRPTGLEKTFGASPRDKIMSGRRVQGSALFVEKGIIPALEVADAVATGMRRFFLGAPLGDEACAAIMGYVLNKDDFAGPSSSQTRYCRSRMMKNWKGKPIPLSATLRWLHEADCPIKKRIPLVFFPDCVSRLDQYMSMTFLHWFGSLPAGIYPISMESGCSQ